MSLSEKERSRLADIVELQPTKNAELQERWGLESGSEVHRYLENELGEFYYRDADSLICATPGAEQVVGNGDGDVGERVVAGTRLQQRVLDVLPTPDGEPQSVVATLHDVRDATDTDPDVDDVRSALHTLADRSLVERVRRTVPTFRLAVERDAIRLEIEE
ncbi:MAG: DUF5797 family protein [Halovenus sp.]